MHVFWGCFWGFFGALLWSVHAFRKSSVDLGCWHGADDAQEDIACTFHECFDFIEAARAGGDRVLVHCSQGVSRSSTIVIAYAMWRLDQSYETIFEHVKKIRGIVNPNIGFTCVLFPFCAPADPLLRPCGSPLHPCGSPLRPCGPPFAPLRIPFFAPSPASLPSCNPRP